jgi:MFS family permease
LRLPVWAWLPPVAFAALLITSIWPMLGLVASAVVAVTVLAVRAPLYALPVALVLLGFEGSIKMRLSIEDAPYAISLGAALIDLALFIGLAGLIASDRARTLRLLWQRAGRAERLVAYALAGWLALAVMQIPLGGNLVDGVEGFRLVHLYVPAFFGGVLLVARMPPDRVAQLLLWVIAPIAAYAAFRGIVGPTDNEREFVEMRTNNFQVGEAPRNSGSFTSSLGLASFLVPAGVFALVLAYLVPSRRPIAVLVFLLSMVGVIASYVRTALVAIVAGTLVLAALMVTGAGVSPRHRRYAAGLILVVLIGGYGATLVAGTADERAERRAESLLNPFEDESVQTRFDTWKASIEKVVDEPVGTGLGTVGSATVTADDRGDDRDGDMSGRGIYTDSSYLLILQEQGFIGGALFLFGILGLTLLCGRRLAAGKPVQRPLGVAALVAFSSFLVLFLMGDYIEQPGKVLSWMLLGVASWEAYRP